MRPSEVLKNFGWCQGHLAVTSKGNSCRVESEKACKFCMQGAVERACSMDTDFSMCRFWGILRMKLGDHPIDWNDRPDRKKEEVIEFLEEVEKEYYNEAK